MLNLTRHFQNNWMKRVGGDPDPEKVNQIVREAIRVQKGRFAKTYSGIFKTLTIYWHPPLGLMLTADHHKNTLVSVYSNENMPEGCTMNFSELMGC